MGKEACVLQRRDGCREGLPNSCLRVGSPGIMTTWGKFALQLTFGGMACKGLRAISYQVTRKFKAGYKPSHTSETLISTSNLLVFNF